MRRCFEPTVTPHSSQIWDFGVDEGFSEGWWERMWEARDVLVGNVREQVEGEEVHRY